MKPEAGPPDATELWGLVEVRAEQHIALARQQVLALAKQIGFARVPSYYVATAVSELASNLFFHATVGGTIQISVLRADTRSGIELLSHDQGPGIADLELAMQDGWSSRGGLGGGLPGVRRLMDGFEISSEPGQGTWVRAWKWQP